MHGSGLQAGCSELLAQCRDTDGTDEFVFWAMLFSMRQKAEDCIIITFVLSMDITSRNWGFTYYAVFTLPPICTMKCLDRILLFR